MNKNTVYDIGYIYRLTNKEKTLQYYGSTKDYKRRIAAHKSVYKKSLAGGSKYLATIEILKLGDFESEVLEIHYNITREALEKIEQQYIMNNPCVNIRGRFDCRNKYAKEYYSKNKMLIKEKFQNKKEKMRLANSGEIVLV